ncbi:Pgant8 [Symbiodinium natans]|uniref:Pgant8 protein n=1 Tax=Symbiodinium natans TaxID=878477 RepID=A0A812QD77_9DINO|nr:Pgant8 [Symbiodinium natans]
MGRLVVLMGRGQHHSLVQAFFDCYVKPLPGWASSALEAIRQSPRSVVLPALRDLGEDWEIKGPNSHFDNIFTWEAETVQLYFDPEYVSWPFPVDQGNVLVFGSQWWQELGGYDRLMRGSSTLLLENIELSLRVHLCGGKFLPLNDSVVGFCHSHHGTLHHERGDMLYNQARIIEAWFGEWASEAMKHPRFADYTSGVSAVGDISETRALQGRLQCAGLGSFLDAYRLPLEILGLLPREVFGLREESAGLCLQEWNKDEWGLSKCDETATGQWFVHKNEDIQDGHLACCSGLGPWRNLHGSSSYCLDGRLGKPGPYGCIHRKPPNSQLWEVRDGLLISPEWGCLVPGSPVDVPREAQVQWSACRFSAPGGQAIEEQRFHAEAVAGTDKFRLLLATGQCLSASADSDARVPSLAPCQPEEESQHWRWAKPSLKLGLKPAAKTDICLDIDNGDSPLLYVCYSMEDVHAPYGVVNTNQALWLTPAGHLTQWGPVDTSFTNLCLDGSAPPLQHRRLGLLDCAEAHAQGVRWEKVGAHTPPQTEMVARQKGRRWQRLGLRVEG